MHVYVLKHIYIRDGRQLEAQLRYGMLSQSGLKVRPVTDMCHP
jgi:hypothetical protein